MEVYTDGSCIPNPGPMGAAYVIISNDKIIHEDSFFLEKGTNNIGEYMAVQKAIEYINKTDDLSKLSFTLFSDSNLVIKQLNKIWKIKDPILKEYYDSINAQSVNITYVHVKAHNGNKWNEYIDQKAKDAIKSLKNKDIITNIMEDSNIEKIIEKMLDVKLKPLLDMQQQLINQNLKLSEDLLNNKPPTKQQQPKILKSKLDSDEVEIKKNENGVFYVTGNTFPIKDDIKMVGTGARWNDNRAPSVWSFNNDVTLDQIKDVLDKKCKLVDKTNE